MKRHSANAERKLRQRANRLKMRNRFREVDVEPAEPGLLLFRKMGNWLAWNRATVLNFSIIAIIIAGTAIGAVGYKQSYGKEYSTAICKLDSAELRTFATPKDLEIKKPNELHKQLLGIVKNAPMSKMVEDIANKDRAVAAYLVGIAMKESKFGTYAPKKNGRDCYNYWGYRGRENTTQSGYSCFDSPEHAVTVVGNKIESMLQYGARTPAQMISWKCGSTCAGHDPESVTKWIADVSINYYKINPSKELAKK